MLLWILGVHATALSLRGQHNVLKSSEYVKVGCKNPGAGMDASLHSASIYKDGFWFLRCMMDEMESDADYHNAQTREHEYVVKTNVSIVRYTDRVEKEAQVKMTPRTCFDFCRTVPEMVYFGLVHGRDCYCTAYYHQVPGDGACDAQCEGDASKTCGSTTGMADMYQMHSCDAGDTVDVARADVTAAGDAETAGKAASQEAASVLCGMDQFYDFMDEDDMYSTSTVVRTKLQDAARPLNFLIETLDADLADCETKADALTSYLDGVDAQTTVASEVLEIEKKQDAVKACTEKVLQATKATKAELLKPSMLEAWHGVGMEKLDIMDVCADSDTEQAAEAKEAVTIAEEAGFKRMPLEPSALSIDKGGLSITDLGDGLPLLEKDCKTPEDGLSSFSKPKLGRSPGSHLGGGNGPKTNIPDLATCQLKCLNNNKCKAVIYRKCKGTCFLLDRRYNSEFEEGDFGGCVVANKKSGK